MSASPPPGATSDALVRAVCLGLRRAGDPERARGAQAYMKSAMPFHGVAAPSMRAIAREAFDRHPLADAATWQATVLALWRGATHREERYVAIELTGYRPYRTFQSLDTVPMYEELIVTGAWWDYVDTIAARRLGPLLAAHPGPMSRLMRRWSRDSDLWRRRSSILSQLTFKDATDLRLLYACIEPNLSDREFFIRKAIGWALRAYAWTNPAEVVRYVEAHTDVLSPLSRREALKNVHPAEQRHP